MSHFLSFLRLEITMFFRARVAVFWTFAFPVLMLVAQMTFFGQGASRSSLHMGLVDQDGTPQSASYLDYVHDSAQRMGGVGARIEVLDHKPADVSHYDVLVLVARGFGAEVAQGRSGGVEIVLGSTSSAALMGSGILRGVTDAYNLREAKVVPAARLSTQTRAASSNQFSYVFYLATGLSITVLLSTCLMGFAGPLVSGREAGLFRMYQMFPVRPAWILAAWGMARLFVTLCSVVLLFLVAHWMYGLSIAFNLLHFAIAICAINLGIAAFLSIGFVVASFSPNISTVTIITNLLYFPLIASGNLLFPTSNLPDFVRRVLEFLPVNALVACIRRSLLGEHNLYMDSVTFALLIAVTAGGMLVASRYFRWTPHE